MVSIIYEATRNLTARTNGNGAATLPETLPLKLRLREYLRRAWFSVTTSKAAAYTMSQPLALCILGVMLTFGGAWYWRSSSVMQEQHDEIIRLKTIVAMQEKRDTEQNEQISSARATAQVAAGKVAELNGRFETFSLIYTVANPAKVVKE